MQIDSNVSIAHDDDKKFWNRGFVIGLTFVIVVIFGGVFGDILGLHSFFPHK